MELKFLEIFCKVVEERGFSKAASALFLTQPTISSHIKTLEDEIGIKLLDRLGRDVVPTKAGEVLYKYAREIVNLKTNAIQALNEFKGAVKGKLVIGGSTIPGEYILPEYIAGFKKTHPDITVTLKIGDTQDIIDMVLNGSVEMGVVGSKTNDKRSECKEFLKDELVLIVSDKHFKNIKGKIDKKDLKNLPIIIREQGSGSRKTIEEIFKRHGIDIEDLNIVAEFGSTEAVKQAVKSGIGVSFVSSFAVKSEIQNKTLKAIPIKDFNITRHFYITIDKTRTTSPICQSFIKSLLPF
ncbi:MAG: LysR family transcriptional regulator [Deltaproteobacteria bacterium]|nr:LysR family transcriptional regulator [Deltaproteobacteria bacterium]